MNVVVLIAGVCDSKWPFGAAQPRVLSPFDESALEVALKLRDADPLISICAVVLGRDGDEPLVRAVASHRPDRLLAVEDQPGREWDLAGLALRLQVLMAREAADAELVLVGRQFGDRDDGTLPPCLAVALGAGFVRMAQAVGVVDGRFIASRERAGALERIALAAPLVASITNDRANRLRHALLKNVMISKRTPVTWTRLVEADAALAVSLQACTASPPPARTQACRMLEGPLAEQAAQLAQYLNEWRQAE